jgi:O-antigen/teichoic acid export membrane protein
VGISGWLLFGAAPLLPAFFGRQWAEAARILLFVAPFAGLSSYFDVLRAMQSARREIKWIVISRAVMLMVVATAGTAIVAHTRSAYATGVVMASSLLIGVLTMLGSLQHAIPWSVVIRHIGVVVGCGILASVIAAATGLGTRGPLASVAESVIWGVTFVASLYLVWRRDSHGEGAALINLIGIGHRRSALPASVAAASTGGRSA